MKLLVIVLCLLNERFWVHVRIHQRFHWFTAYVHQIEQRIPRHMASPWFLLAWMVLPLTLLGGLVFYAFSGWFFGLMGLILNVLVLYYCLGPDNPFYPVRQSTEDNKDEIVVSNYLAEANGQLFAVLFWYVVLGPCAIILYRLVSLCQKQAAVSEQAIWLTSVFDWLPARLTVLLYLLVGHFQFGFHQASKYFFSSPKNNQKLLNMGSLHALGDTTGESVALHQAERLLEHAIILWLVWLSFFTLAALI